MDPAIHRLRGFALLAVILIHSTMHFTELTIINFGFIGTLTLNVLAQFAVPCFFFISGYALTKSYKPEEGVFFFYKKRFSKILPLYLVACLVYGAYFHWDTLSVTSYIRSVLFGSAAYHLWFIPVLLQLYLLFPLIFYIVNKSKWNIGPVSWVVIFFGIQIIALIGFRDVLPIYIGKEGADFITLLGNRFVLFCIGYARLGMLVAQSRYSPFGYWFSAPRVYIQTLVYFIACLILRYIEHTMKLDGVPFPFWMDTIRTFAYAAFSVAMIISLYQWLRHYSLSNSFSRFYDYLAEKSYGIYLFHILVLDFMYQNIEHLVPAHPFLSAIALFTATLVIMLQFCIRIDKGREVLAQTA